MLRGTDCGPRRRVLERVQPGHQAALAEPEAVKGIGRADPEGGRAARRQAVVHQLDHDEGQHAGDRSGKQSEQLERSAKVTQGDEASDSGRPDNRVEGPCDHEHAEQQSGHGRGGA